MEPFWNAGFSTFSAVPSLVLQSGGSEALYGLHGGTVPGLLGQPHVFGFWHGLPQSEWIDSSPGMDHLR